MTKCGAHWQSCFTGGPALCADILSDCGYCTEPGCWDACFWGASWSAQLLAADFLGCVGTACPAGDPACIADAEVDACADEHVGCLTTLCQPECVGKSCGSDGCGGSCGECDGGLKCTPTGSCSIPCSGNVSECVANVLTTCDTGFSQATPCGSASCAYSVVDDAHVCSPWCSNLVACIDDAYQLYLAAAADGVDGCALGNWWMDDVLAPCVTAYPCKLSEWNPTAFYEVKKKNATVGQHCLGCYAGKGLGQSGLAGMCKTISNNVVKLTGLWLEL